MTKKNEILKIEVPEDIFELLWFENGPYENISRFHNEPSAINVELEIDCYIDYGSLWYWPSYVGLNSGQRLRYLKWLCDITEPIDFGYVFLFYYGLERHLLFGKFDKVFKMINKLRIWHKSVSFLEYSQNAMIIAAVLKDRKEMIDKIEGLVTNYFLDLIYIYDDMKITADSIIRNAKRVDWRNDRYIKKNYEVFREILKCEIEQAYKITKGDIGASKDVSISFANYTLNPRGITFPDVFTNEKIKKDLYEILEKTHNIFKQRHRGEF